MTGLWTPGPDDRITADEDGIDEIVLSCVSVHLERLDDRSYYLNVYGSFRAGLDGLLVQSNIAVVPGRRKRVAAYLSYLEAPIELSVDAKAWVQP